MNQVLQTTRYAVLVAGMWIGIVGDLTAQTPAVPSATAACPPVRAAQGNLITSSNCAASTPDAPAAKRFPYPGEQDSTAPGASTPATPRPETNPDAPASKRFPYPGEDPQSTTPAPTSPGSTSTPNGSPLQDAGSSGESSSGSSSSSSSAGTPSPEDDAANGKKADDPDANDPAAIPRSKRHKLPAVPRQTPSEREQEDVQVAGFYFNDGNFRGSYDRAKDAVTLDSDDAAAQLAFGNAARKLGKLDEAEKAYKHCLELDPVPKVRKTAEKALHEMTGDT